MPKKFICILLVFCLSALSLSAAFAETDPEPADLIVYGKIYTADAEGTFAEAAAIRDGKYVYVGDLEGAAAYLSGSTETVTGTFVMPGATDSHAHCVLEEALKLGLYLEHTKEDGTEKTPDELARDILAYREAHPDLEAIYGYGWSYLAYYGDESAFSREMLDIYFPDIPVYISERMLHLGWCNTKCLEAAGALTEEIPAEGINRDENGVATGYIKDEACTYIINRVFDGIGNYDRAVLNAQSILNAKGYTMTLDAWSNFDGTTGLIDAVKAADDSGALTVSLSTSYCLSSYEDMDAGIEKAAALKETSAGARSGLRYLKLFADGIEDTRTAYLLEPYSDGTFGTAIWEDERMTEAVEKANAAGLLVHIHAYGDASARQVVNAFEASAKKYGKLFRNSIAHAPYIADTDLDRIRELQIGIAGSGNWCCISTDDLESEEKLSGWLGEERYSNYFMIDAFPTHGIAAGVSTDRPCADGYAEEVFDYIGVLTTGIDYSQEQPGPARRNTFVSVEEAIRMLTINGARTLDMETERGSIEVGKYADFVIASGDPFATPLEEIHEIEVQGTWFEGENVYTEEGVILISNGLPMAA